MVQYEGHVTEDGELLVNLEGRQVTLREFLQATRMRANRQRRHAESDNRRLASSNFAVAK